MVKFIFGHRNPDTDSVVSSIVYANFLGKKNAKAISLGEINNETKFVLDKFKVKHPEIKNSLPKESEIVLVDHNEKVQSIKEIENLKIEWIIDHHRFDLRIEYPVNIRAEVIGSTCSILFKIFRENNYELSKEEAGLLISGIISDTLFFRSPTSTKEDKEIMNELNKIAKIQDLENYSLEMFNAKSDLGKIHVRKLIKMDYKEYEFLGKKYGIGVIETTNPDYVLGRRKEIMKEIEVLKKEEKLNGILISIIDILNEHNTTIVAEEHEAELLRAVFKGKEIEHNLYSLGKIISRKKEIIPKLEEHFKKQKLL